MDRTSPRNLAIFAWNLVAVQSLLLNKKLVTQDWLPQTLKCDTWSQKKSKKHYFIQNSGTIWVMYYHYPSFFLEYSLIMDFFANHCIWLLKVTQILFALCTCPSSPLPQHQISFLSGLCCFFSFPLLFFVFIQLQYSGRSWQRGPRFSF